MEADPVNVIELCARSKTLTGQNRDWKAILSRIQDDAHVAVIEAKQNGISVEIDVQAKQGAGAWVYSIEINDAAQASTGVSSPNPLLCFRKIASLRARCRKQGVAA